jgi:hypothetical protein
MSATHILSYTFFSIIDRKMWREAVFKGLAGINPCRPGRADGGGTSLA